MSGNQQSHTVGPSLFVVESLLASDAFGSRHACCRQDWHSLSGPQDTHGACEAMEVCCCPNLQSKCARAGLPSASNMKSGESRHSSKDTWRGWTVVTHVWYTRKGSIKSASQFLRSCSRQFKASLLGICFDQQGAQGLDIRHVSPVTHARVSCIRPPHGN